MSTHMSAAWSGARHTLAWTDLSPGHSRPPLEEPRLVEPYLRPASDSGRGLSWEGPHGEGEPWRLGDLQRCGRAALGQGGGGGPGQAGPEAAGEEGLQAPALMSLHCPQLTGGLRGEESLRGSTEPASPHTALSMATGWAGGRMCQLAGKRGRCCLQAAG